MQFTTVAYDIREEPLWLLPSAPSKPRQAPFIRLNLRFCCVLLFACCGSRCRCCCPVPRLCHHAKNTKRARILHGDLLFAKSALRGIARGQSKHLKADGPFAGPRAEDHEPPPSCEPPPSGREPRRRQGGDGFPDGCIPDATKVSSTTLTQFTGSIRLEGTKNKHQQHGHCRPSGE